MKNIRIVGLFLAFGVGTGFTSVQGIEISQPNFDQYALMLNTLLEVEREDIENRERINFQIWREYFHLKKNVLYSRLPYDENSKEILCRNISKPIIYRGYRYEGGINYTNNLQGFVEKENLIESSFFGIIRSILLSESTYLPDPEGSVDESVWSSSAGRERKEGIEADWETYSDAVYAVEACNKLKEIVPQQRVLTDSLAVKAAEQIAATMVGISGGSFRMGCTREQGEDCHENEHPVHEVYVSDYALNKYEVTQEQWRAIMGSDPEDLWNTGCDRCPVERVSWDDAQDFIRELNRISGSDYRLPTEAEWEYAARGGQKSRGFKYSGSDRIDTMAWYGSNAQADNPHGSKGTTQPVGGKRPNELSLYDMSGNVMEWCSDWYASNYYEKSSQKNPSGPSSGSDRVLRGGSWYSLAKICRVSYRFNFNPGYRNYSFGLRLAR